MMFKKDTFLWGLLYGILFPIMGYVFIHEFNGIVTKYWFKGGPGFSQQFQFILAVCFNLIPFTIFSRKKFDYAMRGVLGITFLYFFIILFYFFRNEIFS